MTRKDYTNFAAMFRDAKEHMDYDLTTILYIQGRVEAILKFDNPAFNLGAFSKACSNGGK